MSAVPVRVTSPLITSPGLGEVIMIWPGIQPEAEGEAVDPGVKVIRKSTSGPIKEVGVESGLIVGVESTEAAGRTGTRKIARISSADARKPMINNAAIA